MAIEAPNSATAGSEPDDVTLSMDVTRFLQSLTERQLQVMQGGMRQKFTRDEITLMSRNIVKIVTTLSRQVIVPKIKEENHSHSLELVAKCLANGVVKTVYDALNGQTELLLRDFSTKQTISLPGTPTPSESEGKGENLHLQRPTMKIMYEPQRPESRGRVSMATLVDTMMTSLDLQGSGHFISLENLTAATKRVDDLAATQEFSEMVQLIVKGRLTSSDAVLGARRRLNPTDLERNLASEFVGEFADESVKRLLMSCIVPQPASASTEGIPSLVMPFHVSLESFEISRRPSEVFSDTIDLFTKVIVNNVMDNVSALSDHAVVSNAKETPEIDSHSPEQLNPGPPVISVAALRYCIRGVLLKVQETSSTGAHGSSDVIDDDQIQTVTDDVKALLSVFTAVTVHDDGGHAIKKLHHYVIDAVYAELLRRISPKSEIIEAVKARTQVLTGSLAIAIVRAIKSADAKDLYQPPLVQSVSSPSVKEEPLVHSQITDDAQVASQVSSSGLDTKGHASLATLLALCCLAQLAAPFSDLMKEESSNDLKELIERILTEFSASSSAAKLEEGVSDTIDKHLQRFGEEGSPRKALDPRDSAFGERLALREHLASEAPTAAPESDGTKDLTAKKRKSSFFRFKMPKICIFKKKPKKDNDSAGSRSSDQDHLQSDRTADKGGSSTKKKPSIFTRMLCCRYFCRYFLQLDKDGRNFIWQ